MPTDCTACGEPLERDRFAWIAAAADSDWRCWSQEPITHTACSGRGCGVCEYSGVQHPPHIPADPNA